MSPRRLASRQGFTLLELIVVILIIGILAAFAVPQYMKSLETNKAEDAAALVNMVATTNRMYALDHGGQYATGTLSTNSADNSACPGTSAAGHAGYLIGCKYLAPTDWDSKPYIMAAGDGTTCTAGAANGGGVACAGRRNGPAPGTLTAPYMNWGYMINATGLITTVNGAPTPSQ